ncbi:GDP-mannose 4,6-dehydratase [Dictyobacter aurantiacus]|uniref:GDP-mannose 4,6-dehydratase n=1 Tax=Dictyobacter aurantiacus TaxID=1936993 RepID=A0A401ZQC2_9CHLR|nr:GDP-mannose 4,6-dehydratase [Dictyobacter aurantiacus]GCE09010.1 GDP-mannose 4,6-dehydratase [Dictyobacter aurantiacus]
MTVPARILITGVSGFVGSYLAQACLRRYPKATTFGLYRQHLALPLPQTGIQPISGDVLSLESMQNVVDRARPDLVFHLAAQSSVASSWSDPIRTLRVNAEGAIHLFEALRLAGLMARIVVVGSGEQYGAVPPEANPIKESQPFHPTNPYAVAKATQDLYAYQYFVAYRLPTIRVRPFNHFGPRQLPTFVIASLARQIALIEAGKIEPVLSVGNLQTRHDFLPVEAVVQAYLAVAERGQPGEAYNIGSGMAYSIADILNMLLQHTDHPIRIQQDLNRLLPSDQAAMRADTSQLQRHTNWRPDVDLSQALKHTLDYWRSIVTTATDGHR